MKVFVNNLALDWVESLALSKLMKIKFRIKNKVNNNKKRSNKKNKKVLKRQCLDSKLNVNNIKKIKNNDL